MATNPVPTPGFSLSVEETPEESIVRCSGRITTDTSHELRQTARALIGESKRVVLDFTGVNYLDSSGLGMIVGLLLSAKKSGCKLKLVNLSPRVREIFTITRLGEVLEGNEEYLGLTPD